MNYMQSPSLNHPPNVAMIGVSHPPDSANNTHNMGEFNFGQGNDGENQDYELYDGLDN